MARSTHSRPAQTVSLPVRIARRWREGVVVANLSIAGYLYQLPAIETALFGQGMLKTLGVGMAAGLAWMTLRGTFSSRYDFRQLDALDDAELAARRSASKRPSAARPRSEAPEPTAAAPRPSARPDDDGALPSAPPAALEAPLARARAASTRPVAEAQTGRTMQGLPAIDAIAAGWPAARTPSSPSPYAAPTSGAASAPPRAGRSSAPHANHPSSTLHGWGSSPPPARGQARPDPLAVTQLDAFSDHGPATASRPSGPPTTRMTALQEAELAASPDLARPSEPHAQQGRFSWPEIELTQRARSSSRREGASSAPPVSVDLLTRAVRTPAPANDAVIAQHISAVGAAPTHGATAQHGVAGVVRVDVRDAEANLTPAPLPLELRDQLEELRADVLTVSPGRCFVIAISGDSEHDGIRTDLTVTLALQLAQSGSRRILLVEADAAHPTLERALAMNVSPAVGLSQQLQRRLTTATPAWTVLRIAPALDVIAESGPVVPHGDAFEAALRELRAHFDVIVVHGPVVETSDAAATLAQGVDGIGYVTSGLPSIRVPRERALAPARDKALFRVLTTR